MKLIDTKTHGYLDYIVGIFLMIAPFIFHLDRTSPEGLVFYVLGATAIVYSLFTNYELSLFRLIPMKVHLFLDVLSGIFLAASPWLLGFSDRVCLPHLLLGILEISAGLLTTSKPQITN
ncbi:SPW repeat protein [Flavobacterium sp. MMLR14_040]|uniref:SPW repeat protein n=1 Tax=Flavobacterium sp. MMLR14_040 TaxID=3093843 RepID=UPI00298F7069|nr:SPW repeat protein [Flavobacterium sp. MMLR14_040]MDW8852206.1 SPW repeat protein [Flavobacterium sp. MMLR14_040]